MKITILQENLAKIVGAAARNVSSRPQLPVLANILLKAEKGKLLAVGTDMMTSVGLLSGGQVEEDGAVTVPARDISALAAGLPAGTVELTSDRAVLTVAAGRTKAKLMGIAAADFPEVDGKGKKAFEVDREVWGEALEKVLACVSPDEGRPILTGVKIEAVNSKQRTVNSALKLTATDGYRLGIVEVGVEKLDLEEPVVIPARTLGEVARLGSGKTLTAELTDDGGAVFKFEDGWVKGKLLAGEFPAVDKIIPQEFEVEITVDRGELEKAVKLAAIFARESANIVKFRIQNSELRISANSPQIGENETGVEIAGKGDGEIAFNSRYLLDLLGSTGGAERLMFKMAGPLKPGMFGIEGDKNFKHVIMPVRVQK
jgi:DNA polymerase-3 subunit beta